MPRSHKQFEHTKEEKKSVMPTSVYVPRELVAMVRLKYRAETGDNSFSHWVTKQMKEYLK